MSEQAKSARAAMKAKAKRMGDAGDPQAHVDASSWTPPEMVHSGAKTGMRPISKRAFKRGGKVLHVEGEQAHHHAGRKPRKAGGKALTPNSYINRDSKEANLERIGGKAHVGGYKHGGAPKHKMDGGPLGSSLYGMRNVPAMTRKRGGMAMHDDEATDRALIKKMVKGTALTGKKHGGEAHKAPRKHKADGGEIFNPQDMPVPPARRMPRPPADMGPSYNEDAVNQSIGSSNRSGRKIKKREADLIRALLRGRADGGRTDFNDMGSDSPKQREGVYIPPTNYKRDESGKVIEPKTFHIYNRINGNIVGKAANEKSARRVIDRKDSDYGASVHTKVPVYSKGGKADAHGAGCRCHKCWGGKAGKAEGGKVGDIGGERPQHGGRMARATGGRAKGKTNVNIIISAGRSAQDGMAGPAGLMGAPGAAPAVMPRQAPVMPPAAAGPMPMPPMGGGMPMPPPQMPPPGPMMGRKAGGRVYRSYKDMDAGAGSGLGRLEKTEIQKRK